MAADMYTKRFVDPKLWFKLLYLNNIVLPEAFWEAKKIYEYFDKVTPSRWSKPALVILEQEKVRAFKQCRRPK